MKAFVLALLVLLVASSARAELKLQLPTEGERQAANVVSWGTAVVAVALDTKASWECPHRVRCFELQAARTSVVYGSVFAAKLLVGRARPCAPSDCGRDNPNFSFFSGHAAEVASTIGGARLAVTVPLVVSTMGLRVAAGRHWISDVVVGAGAGWLASRIRSASRSSPS
jgi:membrane-associated phospholipid phosphatase